MKKTINPIERLEKLVNKKDRYVIALSGLPGAGKSTLSNKLADLFSDKVLTLGMDGFHFSKAKLRTFPDPALALARRGAPWTFDVDHFVEKCKELGSRVPMKWPDFSHGGGDPIEDAIDVPIEVDIILVEGLYVLYREEKWAGLKGCFDETWHLDTPVELAQERVIRRHMTTKGLGEEEATQKAKSNDLLNGELVAKSSYRADFLIHPEIV